MPAFIQYVSQINEGIALPLEEGKELTIGRGQDNDVVMPYDFCASKNHATVKLQNNKFFLRDLDSTNGTYLDGDRIESLSFVEFKGLFVAGFTLFNVVHRLAANHSQGSPLKSSTSHISKDNLLFRTSLDFARPSPILHFSHLFLALIRHHGDELSPFFKKIEVEADLDQFGAKVRQNRMFSGKDDWLNQFMSKQPDLTSGQDLFITPLAQDFLRRMDVKGAKPLALLRSMLSGEFNLVFPLLEWRTTRSLWSKAFDDLIEPQSRPVKKAPLPRQPVPPIPTIQQPASNAPAPPRMLAHFENMDEPWSQLAKKCASGKAAVLTGAKGCGKTTALRLAFQEKVLRNLPKSLVAYGQNLVDCRILLASENDFKVNARLHEVLDRMTRPCLTILDHFDELLTYLKRDQYDLFLSVGKKVSRPLYPTIIVIRDENLDMIDDSLKMEQRVDMNLCLQPLLPEIYSLLLHDHEKRLNDLLSVEAKNFFLSKVAKRFPYNFRVLGEFLEISVMRNKSFAVSRSDMNGQTYKFGRIGEVGFRETYNDWLKKTTPQSEPAPRIPLAPPVHQESSLTADRKFIEQVESLFQKFSSEMFKIPLNYSDGTKLLNTGGRLSREQKLDELKEHLVRVFIALHSTFRLWFQAFWKRIAPEYIIQKVGKRNHKKLWDEYEARTKYVDASYAEEIFQQEVGKYIRKLRGKAKKPRG